MDYILLRRNNVSNGKITMDNLPLFVEFEGSTNCLRLIKSKNNKPKYYRDGGRYSVNIIITNGEIFSLSRVNSVNNIKLLPVSKTKWKKSNGRYTPDDSMIKNNLI